MSDVWEKMGGGQADIYYPDLFEGCWQVGSTLVSVDAPKGIEYANDVDQIQQAIDNELNKTLSYEQCFVRNSRNKVVADRSYNTRKITEGGSPVLPPAAPRRSTNTPSDISLSLVSLSLWSLAATRSDSGAPG